MVNKLSEELRHVRGIRNASLRDVEKATGISNAYISQLEHGDVKSPSPNKLHKLAEYYDIPYDSLMESAGYVDTTKSQNRKKTKPPGVFQSALLTADLTKKEEKKVIEYIKFLKSQKSTD